MKINYERFPILRFLENPNQVDLEFDKNLYAQFKKKPLNTKDFFSDWLNADIKPHFLSRPFTNAAMLHHNALREVMGEMTSILPDQIGIFLIGNQFVFYQVKNEGLRIAVGAQLTVYGIMHFKGDTISGYFASGYYQSGVDSWDDRDWWVQHITTTLHFFQHCEIETKIIAARSERRIRLDRYLNQTATNVGVINCTWFTTLVSTIAHGVTGHFRWQPCGEGRADRKLIWIQDFVRGGFVKPARVLNHEGKVPN